VTTTTDLIEQLRQCGEKRSADGRGSRICDEAADLIERVIGDVPQDAIDGGWTALGMSKYAKGLEAQIETLQRNLSEMTADRDSWRDQASQRVADWEAMRRERDELRAARIAYASEFAPNGDGYPDVGSIHENIRKLKRERDEAVAELGNIANAKRFDRNMGFDSDTTFADWAQSRARFTIGNLTKPADGAQS
jgi:hypothetical protein